MRSATCLVLMLFLLSACAGDPFWLPRAHKISVQQGNLINEQQLSQVTVGMDREKVRELIGTPVVNTPFQQDRSRRLRSGLMSGDNAQRPNLLTHGSTVSF